MVKRKRGRPRRYKDGTEILALRVPAGMAKVIEGALSAIRLAKQDADIPKGVLLLDGLKRCLRSQENFCPSVVGILRDIERLEERLLSAE